MSLGRRSARHHRALAIAAVAWGTCGVLQGALASPPSYSHETDPVRRGFEALRKGQDEAARTLLEEAVAAGYEVPQACCGLASLALRRGDDAAADSLATVALADPALAADRKLSATAHTVSALAFLHRGRPADAAPRITEALRLQSDLWDARYAQCLWDVAGGKLDEAEAILASESERHGVENGEDRLHHARAVLALARGELADAEREALLASTLAPGVLAYLETTADVYVANRQPFRAIQSLEKIAKLPGMVPGAAQSDRLGRLYAEAGQPNEALRQFQEAVKADSTFAPAFKELARLYAMGNVHDKSFLAWSRYVSLAPDDLDALLPYAREGLLVRQFQPARDAIARAYAADSTRAETRLLYARAAAQTKQADLSRALYAGVPDTLLEPVDHVRLGALHLDAQRWDDALRELETAVSQDSTSAEAFLLLGSTQLRRGHAPDAETALARAAELAPRLPAAFLNLGIARVQQQKVAEGLVALRKADELSPDNVAVLLALGQAFAAADSTADAIASYRHVLELDSANARAYRGLGVCQLRRKSWGDAVTALRSATSLDGNNAESWAGLAQAYLGLNDVTHAAQAADRALALDPAQPMARSVRDVTNRARPAR